MLRKALDWLEDLPKETLGQVTFPQLQAVDAGRDMRPYPLSAAGPKFVRYGPRRTFRDQLTSLRPMTAADRHVGPSAWGSRRRPVAWSKISGRILLYTSKHPYGRRTARGSSARRRTIIA